MTNLVTPLNVGDTWSWTADYSDYPRPTWTATAYFGNSANEFTVSSSASGTTQLFAATAATTAAFKAGRYFVQVRVTDGTNKYIAEEGWVDVNPDPAAAGKTDRRSWARRTLEAVEAFIEGNASTAQQSMSVGGRSLSRWSIAELMQLRSQLRGEVRTEEQGDAAGLGRDIKVRYG